MITHLGVGAKQKMVALGTTLAMLGWAILFGTNFTFDNRALSTSNGNMDLPPDIIKRQRLKKLLKNRMQEHHGFALPESVDEWCLAQTMFPQLPYKSCEDTVTVNSIPLEGSDLAGILQTLLLGTILSFEEGKCFFIDELTEQATMPWRKDPRNNVPNLLDRYLEPIGMPFDSMVVQKAVATNSINVITADTVWGSLQEQEEKQESHLIRRPFGKHSSIDALGYQGMEGHKLKRIMLRRMFRPIENVRKATCKGLAHYDLLDDFIAMAIYRTTLEADEEEPRHQFSASEYAKAADEAATTHFHGIMPAIFVATDDCDILSELRYLRPSTRFVSECDNPSTKKFATSAMSDWNVKQTDAAFSKFWIDVFAMGTAKYYIGVSSAKITWWVWFMRATPDLASFQLLDLVDAQDKRFVMEQW